MRTVLAILISCSLFTPLCGAQTASSSPQPLDECQVIARVGKQVVLSCEVLWRVNLLLEENRDRIPKSELKAAREHLLKQNLASVIDTKLLYADFRSKLPEANLPQIHGNLEEPFLKERVPQLMKQIGVKNQSQIDARMQELGGSLEDVRQDFFQSMIAQSWARESTKVNRVVTHQELLDVYHEKAASYDYPAQVKWEELMVAFRNFNDQNQAWAAMCEMGNTAFPLAAQNQKSGGEVVPAFDAIAKLKSQGFTAKEGGVHDWTTKGALAAENIDEALFSLQIGEMSPILRTDQGFHIVRVLERKTAGRKPFTEVQDSIRSQIVNKRFNTAIQKKLTELRNTTKIWTIYGGTTTAKGFMQALRASSPTRR